MAETLVHAVPLPHLDLEKIVDQVCGWWDQWYVDYEYVAVPAANKRKWLSKQYNNKRQRWRGGGVVTIVGVLNISVNTFIICFILKNLSHCMWGSSRWASWGDLKVNHLNRRQRKVRAKFRWSRRVGGDDSSEDVCLTFSLTLNYRYEQHYQEWRT